MSDRPSDAFELDELRDEFDWMFEFNSRMAERISEDPDVHNLADYVSGLEHDNAKLRELAKGYEALTATLCNERECDGCPFDDPERIVCEHMSLQTCLAELGVEVDG